MYIDSPQNLRIKEWSKLKTKRGREQSQCFLVEGIRLTEELLNSSYSVRHILWDVGTDEVPQSIRDAALARRVGIVEVSPSAFASVADTVTPQGILAIADIPQENPVVPRNRADSHVLLLDGLQDPGNLGTLIRSADAFGIGTVYAGTGTVDPYSPKVVRASMGGLFRVNVETGDSTHLIQRWKGLYPNGQVVLTTATGSVDCYATDLTCPSLLLIGSEAFGASQGAGDLADVKVRIPMTGLTDSLNAAVAGSILMYETSRQRALGGEIS